VEWATGAGAHILLFGEPEYPDVLADLGDPPTRLFGMGDVGLLRRPCVGIVGTRHASLAGERIAYQLAVAFARAGVTVVSGMALGIDAAAHRGALDAGGGTIAVLGGGVDLPYPPSHAPLHGRITSEGLVLSEAMPGTRPVKGAFPRRNRIIAGLGSLLIVVEAGHRSGALITARLALDLGRSVAAVPGPIESPRHAGSNQLLAAGALFITSPADALAMMKLPGPERSAVPPEEDLGDALTSPERQVMEAISRGASDPDGIARVTGLTAREIGSAVSSLELTGVVRSDHGGILLAHGADR
jgi:DNA processing protein